MDAAIRAGVEEIFVVPILRECFERLHVGVLDFAHFAAQLAQSHIRAAGCEGQVGIGEGIEVVLAVRMECEPSIQGHFSSIMQFMLFILIARTSELYSST